ncbi:MAG: hypothetical protein AAF236_00135 [Verrucomicrobiota bacterium]
MSEIHHPIHLLSRWCLDAPLVAMGWAIWISRVIGEGHDWNRVGALGAVVWTIYLFDRYWDTRSIAPEARTSLPIRKCLKRSHRRSLVLLISVAMLLGLVSGLRATWSIVDLGVGALLLVLVGAYAVLGIFPRRLRLPFPFKELMVGGVFAGGVFFAGYPEIASVSVILVLAAWSGLGALFFFNCLTISAAERQYDSIADRRAFFATSKRVWPSAWRALLVFPMLSAAVIFRLGDNYFLGAILIVAAGSQLIVSNLVLKQPKWVQPIGDLLLLVGWVALLIDA